MENINPKDNGKQDLANPRGEQQADITPVKPAPPSIEDSQPVLPRPGRRRAEDFLPEWLRRLSHG